MVRLSDLFQRAAECEAPDEARLGAPRPSGRPIRFASTDSPTTISKLNIKRCWRLLAAETDPAKRATITKLIAEEEAKLRELERRDAIKP